MKSGMSVLHAPAAGADHARDPVSCGVGGMCEVERPRPGGRGRDPFSNGSVLSEEGAGNLGGEAALPQ